MKGVVLVKGTVSDKQIENYYGGVMKYIKEEVESYKVPENLKEFIAFWQEKLEDLPLESQREAEVEFSSGLDNYNNSYYDIGLTYYREETKEELKQRELKEVKTLAARKEFVKAQILKLQEELEDE